MDIFQKVRKSYSIGLKARKANKHASGEPTIQEHITYDHFKTKYETTSHPLTKKTKMLGYKVTRWFRLIDGKIVYSKEKPWQQPLKAVALKDIEIFEVHPIIRKYNFCIKLEGNNELALWIHCNLEIEKHFLLGYLRQSHNTIDIVDNPTLETMSRPVIVVEDTQAENEVVEKGIGSLESLAMEENIALEFCNDEPFTLEQQLQMYQKVYNRLGKENIIDQDLNPEISRAGKYSVETSQTEAGIGNNIPRLPPVKKISGLRNKDFLISVNQAQIPSLMPYINSLPNLSHDEDIIDHLNIEMYPPTKRRMEPAGCASARNIVKSQSVIENYDDNLSDASVQIAHSARQVQVRGFGGNCLMQPCAEDSLQVADQKVQRVSVLSTRKLDLPTKSFKKSPSQLSLNNSLSEVSQKNEKGSCSTRGPKLSAKEASPLKVYQEKSVHLNTEKETNKAGSNNDIDIDQFVRYFQPEKINSVEECIRVGHQLLWRHEISKAKECFALYKDKDFLVEMLDCECDLHEIFLSGYEIKVKQALSKLNGIQTRINYESISCKEDPEKYFSTELNKAELHFYKCIMYCFLGNRFQGIKAIADAWRTYKRLENQIKKKEIYAKLSPDSLHRYKFGHGCFAITFSSFSPTLVKLVKLIGIKAEKDEGFKLLEECRKEQGIRSHYAAIFLSLYKLEILGALEDASEIVSDALRDSYGNGLFYWIGSLVCWKYTKVLVFL